MSFSVPSPATFVSDPFKSLLLIRGSFLFIRRISNIPIYSPPLLSSGELGISKSDELFSAGRLCTLLIERHLRGIEGHIVDFIWVSGEESSRNFKIPSRINNLYRHYKYVRRLASPRLLFLFKVLNFRFVIEFQGELLVFLSLLPRRLVVGAEISNSA
ncbi:hypothetical protein K435DRAFT_490712 [Dendrothele bispora CBS 962.96]|uniref:Uncharacterized protein n=1 Tax=Dendrothele bispora (strain CBS 962.96) TaxID=1314807 RepID=A0A4S8MBA5_DENBC|nr:hypothetical protein K435DRAFT_490712 [Dendrothele bispora CBS 962.96]